MKNLLTLAFVCIATLVFGNKTTFQKLVEVNKCWTEQHDVLVSSLPLYEQKTEHDWIGIHLALVEQKLRERNAKALNGTQQANRLHCLDILHRYWQEGNFPLNEDYSFRTPIFIDQHNNFCAVGFLMKETGNEVVCRSIAAQTNLAYVKEMKYPELATWADDNGFTIDELAWIQPGYPPNSRCGRVGKGVEGSVQELFVDESEERMYAGGAFIRVDSSFAANNIAYVTEALGVYTWHSMGAGVNGKVNAITKLNDKLFVAGSFDSAGGNAAANVAYWDGSAWQSAGCLDGTVNDLLVFEGTLYAVGSFKSCDAAPGKNFAYWNGTKWWTIDGLDGQVNTMEIWDGSLILGGAFNYGSLPDINAIKWSPLASFQTFTNSIRNEVMDFEKYQDTLYAACKLISKTDSNLLLKLKDNEWITDDNFSLIHKSDIKSAYGMMAINSIYPEASIMNIGGQFHYFPMLGTSGRNALHNGFSGDWLMVDSAINKMVMFKSALIAGGKFKQGYVSGDFDRRFYNMNGITVRLKYKANIPNIPLNNMDAFSIYPNPAKSGGLLKLENVNTLTEYTLSQTDGKVIAHGQLNARTELRLPQIPAGIYFITLSNADGGKVSKLLVE